MKKSVPIQPKAENIFPENWRSLANVVNFECTESQAAATCRGARAATGRAAGRAAAAARGAARGAATARAAGSGPARAPGPGPATGVFSGTLKNLLNLRRKFRELYQFYIILHTLLGNFVQK